MNKYFIKELNTQCTYLELRILMYLECEEKMKKLTEMLNFLKQNNFLIDLSILYYKNMRAENIPEFQDTASLTIDLRDDKFRFKYWDGAKTYWVYHLQDLYKVLIDGREDFEKLFDKYQPVTQLLYKIRDETDEIYRIRYQYYPNVDTDILYEIQFHNYLKDTYNEDKILKDIFNQINNLKLEDLKMDIDYSFKEQCLPCQKAKEKNNERENMERQK